MRSVLASQRGAAMAELCLLAPLLILVWQGVDYFRSAYARLLQTNSDAQAQAWEKAYSNDGSCFRGGAPWSGVSSGAGPAMPQDQKGEELHRRATSSAFRYGTVRVRKTRPLPRAGWRTGAGHVAAEMFLTCNESVAGPSADSDLAKPLWDFLQSWFHF